MNKQFRFLIIVLTAVVLSGTSCKKDDKDWQEGIITGYVKSAGYYNGDEFIAGDIFGMYLLSEDKDSLLAFNIPEPTLNSLLGVNIKSLSYGDRQISKISIPVHFNYREATETELKIAAVSKRSGISALLQVIIIEIKKTKTQSSGGSDGIPSCCQ